MAERPQFSIGATGVRIEPSFLVVIGLIGMFAPGPAALALWVAIATVSVLVHELGHAWAFRRYGSPASVQLRGLGGLTTGVRLPPARSLVVSLAGPLAAVVLLGLPAVAAASVVPLDDGSLWSLAVLYAIYLNIVWSLLNLLPVLPLDGGNAVQALLAMATGRDAQRLTQWVSVGFSVVAAVVALALGLVVVAVLAGAGVAVNVVGLVRGTSDHRRAVLAGAQRSLALGDRQAAVHAAEALVSSGGPAAQRGAAVDVQVWAWLLAGEPARAHLALHRRPAGVPVPASLQGGLALVDGQHDRALTLLSYGLVVDEPGPAHLFAVHLAATHEVVDALVAELASLDDDRGRAAIESVATLLHHGGWYTQAASVAARRFAAGGPDREVWAYNTACSLCRARREDEALSWLATAVEAGWGDLERLESDPDLQALRSRPELGALRRPARR